MYLFIDSVTCFKQDDITGADDIYLIIQNGFPHTVNVGELLTGQTRQVTQDVVLSEEGKHSLEFWERDSVSANDHLGTVFLDDYPRNIDQEAVVDNGSASYKLWFKLVEESR